MGALYEILQGDAMGGLYEIVAACAAADLAALGVVWALAFAIRLVAGGRGGRS